MSIPRDQRRKLHATASLKKTPAKRRLSSFGSSNRSWSVCVNASGGSREELVQPLLARAAGAGRPLQDSRAFSMTLVMHTSDGRISEVVRNGAARSNRKGTRLPATVARCVGPPSSKRINWTENRLADQPPGRESARVVLDPGS
jgi:hypothetical protein